MWKFDFPWAFLLLPVPILVWWLVPAYRTTASAVRVPFFHELADAAGETPAPGGVRLRSNWLQRLMMPLLWALLVVAAAKPVLVEPPVTHEEPARDLMLAIDPELFPSIEGSTDSEVLFFLALTFGLELAPVTALERMVAFVEATGRKNGIEQPLNMTVCATDGEQIVAVRYSSERDSRTLFHSSSFHQLHELYPHDPRITAAGDDAFLVLSEPLVDLPGWWKEIPESTAVVARGGEIEQYPFNPHRG